MARPITRRIDPIKGFTIQNVYSDKTTEEFSFLEGDIVSNFKFAGNNEMTTCDCKIKNVTIKNKLYPTKKRVNANLTTSKVSRVDNITIDCSEQYNARVETLKAMEVLEYNPSKEVVKVNILPIIKVSLYIGLSDDTSTSAIIEEGMVLSNVTLMKSGSEIVDSFKVVSFIYSGTLNGYQITGVLLSNGVTTYKADFYDFKSVGTTGTVITNVDEVSGAIDTALNSSTNDSVIIGACEYSNELNLTSSITIMGNKALEPANTGARATDEIAEDETIFKGVITGAKNADITISGVTITETALINIGDAKSIKFRNCKFVNATPNKNNSYLILDGYNADSEGTVLQVEGCYFGTNTKNELGKIYNLLELNCALKDGSYIKNCYFAKAACTHNVINLYTVKDNTTITIENNVFEMSANACRIGFRGAPENVVVNFNKNTYNETDSDPDWAGLLIIQPYGSATTSLAGVRVNLKNTKFTDETSEARQLWYIWMYQTDTQIVGDLCPQVYVNGIKSEMVYPPSLLEQLNQSGQ